MSSCPGILLPTEYFALQAIYAATNGPAWNWSSESGKWKFDGDITSPCAGNWQGIQCFPAALVNGTTICVLVYLDLAETNLVGTLPSEIGLLANLRFLDVSYNQLIGTIPSSLSTMSAMQYIFMHYNSFTGPITTQFDTMTNIKYFVVYQTKVSGPIPLYFSNFQQLQILYIMENQLTGTIPSNIGEIPYLTVVGFNENYLTGTIPTEISHSQYLRGLGLYVNYLTGTLPTEFGVFSLAFGLGFYSNMLSGTLPEQYCQLSNMIYFATNDNSMEGTIPNCYCNLNLISLSLRSNFYAGTIPDCVGNLSYAEQIWLEGNLLTGTLPSSFGRLSSLKQLTVSSNKLRGKIPSDLAKMKSIELLDISNNQFGEDLRIDFNRLRNLSLFNASRNLFSGDLSYLFPDYSSEPIWESLQYIDLSMNRFSGSIPKSIFSASMRSVSLNSNCFEGSLPTTICDSVRMETLILDGLVTGESCLLEVPGSIKEIISGRFARSVILGTIPSCIWQLSELKTFHVADNGLIGSLGELSQNSSLEDLIVSNNHLTGSIPITFQTKGNFKQLILSENRISGTLSERFLLNSDENSLVKLRVNRLSGSIPNQFFNSTGKIDILNGNLFECRMGNLPSHDPVKDQYSCGSNNLNNSLIAWIVSCSAIFIILLSWNSSSGERLRRKFGFGPTPAARKSSNSPSHSSATVSPTPADENSTGTSSLPKASLSRHVWSAFMLPWKLVSIGVQFAQEFAHMTPYHSFTNCNNFFSVMQRSSKVSTYTALLYLFVAMPLFILLKLQDELKGRYSTHNINYAWVSTVAYLHGIAPVAIVVGMIFISQQLMRYLYFSDDLIDGSLSDLPAMRMTADSQGISIAQKLVLRLAIHLFNIACTLLVNFAYVAAIIHGLDSYALLGIQVGLSVYKLMWDKLVVPNLIHRMTFLKSRHGTGHQVFMTLFNYIFGPIIAVITTDSSCMLYMFVPHSTITSSFTDVQPSDPICVPSTTSFTVVCGVTTIERTLYTELQPTWRYSYQCGSQLLNDYVPVLILTYTFSGVIAPFFRYLTALLPAKFIRKYVPKFVDEWILKDSILFQDKIVVALEKNESQLSDPANAGPPSPHRKAQIRHVASVRDMATLSRSHLFDGSTVIRRCLLDLSVLMTFGLASPLLGATVCLSTITASVLWKTLITTYIKKGKELQVDTTIRVESATAHAADGLLGATYIVVLIISIFWSLLLFDMIADVYGNTAGASLIAIVFFCNPMVYFVSNVYSSRKRRKVLGDKSSNQSPESPAEKLQLIKDIDEVEQFVSDTREPAAPSIANAVPAALKIGKEAGSHEDVHDEEIEMHSVKHSEIRAQAWAD